MSKLAIETHKLHKYYRMGDENLHVLRGASFSVAEGEFVAIIGASGSGKSTLLHLVGLLDRPDKGDLFLSGMDVQKLSAGRRNRMRCEDIGFVFQFYHLLPEMNILENVLIPAQVDSSTLGWLGRRKGARERAMAVLADLGLDERLKHKPAKLSGGERQRVAIARALINQPKILLADEPTGNLDSKAGKQIIKVLKKFHTDKGQTILMVTHDQSLADQADRILYLRDGILKDKE